MRWKSHDVSGSEPREKCVKEILSLSCIFPTFRIIKGSDGGGVFLPEYIVWARASSTMMLARSLGSDADKSMRHPRSGVFSFLFLKFCQKISQREKTST